MKPLVIIISFYYFYDSDMFTIKSSRTLLSTNWYSNRQNKVRKLMKADEIVLY